MVASCPNANGLRTDHVARQVAGSKKAFHQHNAHPMTKQPFGVVLTFALVAWFGQDSPAADEAVSKTVNVRQTGAVGDAKADDTAAIQRALDGGRRTVTIPPGQYKISDALKVDSHTTIKADPKACIRLADGAGTHVGVFLLTNRNFDKGNSHITVEGGIWDGNAANNPRGREGDPKGYTGTAVNFINVKHLVLRGLTTQDPEAFAIRMCQIEDFLIEDITFDHKVIRPNQDGVHLNGYCFRGVIRNLRAVTPRTTNDDMVALNADDDSNRVINLGMKLGPIRDIKVENIRGNDVYTFIRLLSLEHPIENVTISKVAGGCRFYAVNIDRWRFPPGGGRIRNVTLRDFEVRKVDGREVARHSNRRPLIPIQSAVENLRIENFRRPADDTFAAPTVMLDNDRPNHVRLEGASVEVLGNNVVVPGGGIGLMKIDTLGTEQDAGR